VRSALLAAALLGVFADVFLFRRLLAETLASAPLPASVRPRPASLDPDRGFVKRFAAPALPIAVPSLAAFPVFWFAQTYEELALGMLLISMVISLSATLLSTELLLWSHHARRLEPEREGDVLQRLYRLGVAASEVWETETPVVSFWHPAVHLPAVISGSRVIVWERLRSLDRERLAGLALARRAAFWPFTFWPLFAAAGVRALDKTSVLPWWLFAIPAGLALAQTIPDAVRQVVVRNRLRSDAAASVAIEGSLEMDLAGAAFIAARGDGFYHRTASTLTWVAAVRRARAAAALARMNDADVDAAVTQAGMSAELQ
jgi:hypothetical protein